MRPSEFGELQAFVAIAQERNFRKAASRLNLTSSTLSQSLRSLEERLNVRLIARTTRTVAPTEAGLALLAELQPALDAMAAALEGVNAFRASPRGSVRLTVPRSAATMVLAPRFAAFEAAHPDVTLEVSVDDRFVDIVGEGFDAGIRLSESVALDMVAVRLTPDLRAAVVASPAYFARVPAPQTPHELGSQRCIGRRAANGGPLHRWEFAQDGAPFSVDARGPLVLNADDLMLRAALDGVGIAFLNEVDVAPHLAAGRLLRVLEAWCPPIPGFHLYHPRSRQTSASLRALIDVLKAPVG